jgi:hypothetical protein
MGLAKGSSPRIFEQTSTDDGTIYGGKTSMNATVYSNSSRILSIGFDEASCGMTCAYWHRYHNFNPGNGDRIQLEDLFNDDGYKEFRDLVFRRRSGLYRKEVSRKVPVGERQYMLDQTPLLGDDELRDFYVQQGSLLIDGENFLSKNNKFFGLNMKVRFGLNEFKSLLNDYGKAVFGLSKIGVGRFRSMSLPQLFEGKVDNKWPFALVLTANRDGSAYGVYAYLQHGVGIDLQGEVSETGEFIFTERVLRNARPEVQWLHDGEYVENATIKAKLNNHAIVGEWTSRDKQTTLPFSAKR